MRLIDADALIEVITELHKIIDINDRLTHALLDGTIMLLNDAPTVDAVNVVRCKDCKHYEEELFPNGTFKRHTCRNPYMGLSEIAELDPEDFCSYAERG